MQVVLNGIKYVVVDARVNRNSDGTCTASGVIRGMNITVNYEVNAFRLPECSIQEGKPWLREVRRDLCEEFERRYGRNAHPEREVETRGRKRKEYDDGLYVDLDFLNRIADAIKISVTKGVGAGVYVLSEGKYEITSVKTGMTRKADLCNRLRHQMDIIRRIQTEQKIVDQFFAEFTVA